MKTQIIANNGINLVIACYLGKRIGDTYRNCDSLPIKTKNYIDKQITCLMRYKHNLKQITFVISKDNPHDVVNYNFPNKIQNTFVKVLERPNNALSFGAWSEAMYQYKDEFDYYLLLEDDYMFVHDNFDQLFIDGIEKDRLNGIDTDFFVVYAASKQCMNIGIIKKDTLQKKGWLSNFPFPLGPQTCEGPWLQQFKTSSFKSEEYVWPFYTRIGLVLFRTLDENRDIKTQKIIMAPNEIVDEKGDVVMPNNIHKVTYLQNFQQSLKKKPQNQQELAQASKRTRGVYKENYRSLKNSTYTLAEMKDKIFKC